MKVKIRTIRTRWGRCNCYCAALDKGLNSFVGTSFDVDAKEDKEIEAIILQRFIEHCEQFFANYKHKWNGWEHATFTFEWNKVTGEDIE